MHHKGGEGIQRRGDQIAKANRIGLLRRPAITGVTGLKAHVNISRIEQQARTGDRGMGVDKRH